jgi:hypothetical protein
MKGVLALKSSIGVHRVVTMVAVRRVSNKKGGTVAPRAPFTPPETASRSNSDPLDVIGALTEAERISGTKLDFTKIISIGNQSSGKSSVIDAITGFEITPKGTGMVSKRPLRIRLRRVDTGRWAEFPDGTKLFNFKEIQQRIERENQLGKIFDFTVV